MKDILLRMLQEKLHHWLVINHITIWTRTLQFYANLDWPSTRPNLQERTIRVHKKKKHKMCIPCSLTTSRVRNSWYKRKLNSSFWLPPTTVTCSGSFRSISRYGLCFSINFSDQLKLYHRFDYCTDCISEERCKSVYIPLINIILEELKTDPVWPKLERKHL